MNRRWLGFFICVLAGLALLAGGLLVPAHLRAVDSSVIEMAGRKSPTLLERGQALAGQQRLGAAQCVALAARQAEIPGWDRLAEAITNQARQNPPALMWGNDSRAANVFPNAAADGKRTSMFSDFVIREENRAAALSYLHNSQNPSVQELLHTRSLNHTVLFPASSSASGQAFDAAVCTCGLLLDGNQLSPDMSRAISNLASQANHGSGSEPLEQVLMAFLSLGQRFNWDQLTAFVAAIPDPGTLERLAGEARSAGEQLPVLLAAVDLSGQPVAVANYLAAFSQTGLADLSAALRYGAGGVSELVERQQQLYHPAFEQRLASVPPFGAIFYAAAGMAAQKPSLAMSVKWILYLLAGFFLALSLHAARPKIPDAERPLQVRGIHLVREFLISLAFLLVVLLLSEPFLARENQEGTFSLRLLPSTLGGTVPAGIASITQTVMNPTIMLTLLVFFVLQALIYVACLVKLAEIRRQNVSPRIKLKLLENEDHLFDAGLYLGFVGTIVSLIIASLGLVKFSLMAAYSSTSFGIIFVVIFKIFHLRPERRRLLLAAEAQDSAATIQTAAVAPALP